MQFSYKTQGTCSQQIFFEIDDANKTLSNVKFVGGCDGNLKSIGILTDGMKAEEVASKLCGVRCGYKSTSCGDQFSKAITEALKQMEK